MHLCSRVMTVHLWYQSSNIKIFNPSFFAQSLLDYTTFKKHYLDIILVYKQRDYKEDNYETFLTPDEYYGWVDDAENRMVRFLMDCFVYMDEGMRDVTISSFVLMLRTR